MEEEGKCVEELRESGSFFGTRRKHLEALDGVITPPDRSPSSAVRPLFIPGTPTFRDAF